MADSNLAQLAFLVEEPTAYNAALGSGDEMQLLRYTSESLSYDITSTSSQEIRSDRATADLIQTGASTSGGFNFELSATTFDDFFAGALYSAGWSTPTSITPTTATYTASSSTLAAGSSAFTDVVVGQWLQVKGLTTAGTGYFRVTTRTSATQLVVFTSLSANDGGTQCTIAGSYIRNGTTEKSFAFEKKIVVNSTTATNVFFQYTGMIINQMSLSAKSDAVMTGSFDFMGASADVSSTTAVNATLVAATTTPVLNATSNVGGVFEGRPTFSAIEGCLIQGIDLTLNNNLRQIKGIGRKEACDVGVGQCDVKGNLTAYFFGMSIYQKYLDGTETAISFRTIDSDGHGYVFTLPRLKIETDKTNIGGSNQDIMENMTYVALYDSNSNCQIQIDKF
jgi:hypothetical protein